MNQIATTTPGAIRAQPQAEVAGMVAKTLRAVRDRYLRPMEELQAFTAANSALLRLGRSLGRSGLPAPATDLGELASAALRAKSDVRRPDSRGRSARAKCSKLLQALPAAAPIAERLECAQELMGAHPDPKKNRLLVAALVDRYPNLRAHEPATYTEGLVLETERRPYSPTTVAWACDEVVRTKHFLPSPAEFHEALERAPQFCGLKEGLEGILRLRSEIEGALEEAKRLGPVDLTQEWTDALTEFQATGRWYQAGPRPDQEGCEVPAEFLKQFGYGEAIEGEG